MSFVTGALFLAEHVFQAAHYYLRLPKHAYRYRAIKFSKTPIKLTI